MADPNTMPTISHPYPPSYRSQVTPSSPSSSRGDQMPSPMIQQIPQDTLSPPSSNHLEYEKRRDDRRRPRPYPSNPVDQQYQNSIPFDNNAAYSNANSPYSQEQRYGQTVSPGQYGPPGQMREPYGSPSPRPEGMGINRGRSSSDSSLQPVLPKSGEGGLGAAESARGDVPAGWTKEDEEAEREFMSRGLIDWQDMKHWKFWFRKEWWYYYVALVLILVLVGLMAIYHDQIVHWLTPVANWMKNLPAGWVIPIAIMFVISFPPLFGQEIVAILVGAVWGLWIGFGIISAGTLLGEIGNFYAFKYVCRSRAAKFEQKNLSYACLAHIVREGGFFMIFVARMSAIPGHFTTAVFATCGMNILIFIIACILTMPKQLILVYLGVIFDETSTTTKSKIISDSVFAVGAVITFASAWYIYRRMNAVRLTVWREQRMEQKAKGISDIPLAMQKRQSYKQYPSTPGMRSDEEEELTSPMMNRRERDQRQSYLSYSNPYDISYQSTDNMSVYDVDGPVQPQPGAERDIGYAHQPAYASTDSFPRARPSPSSMPRQQAPPPQRYPDAPNSTSFPVAHPAANQLSPPRNGTAPVQNGREESRYFPPAGQPGYGYGRDETPPPQFDFSSRPPASRGPPSAT